MSPPQTERVADPLRSQVLKMKKVGNKQFRYRDLNLCGCATRPSCRFRFEANLGDWTPDCAYKPPFHVN